MNLVRNLLESRRQEFEGNKGPLCDALSQLLDGQGSLPDLLREIRLHEWSLPDELNRRLANQINRAISDAFPTQA